VVASIAPKASVTGGSSSRQPSLASGKSDAGMSMPGLLDERHEATLVGADEADVAEHEVAGIGDLEQVAGGRQPVEHLAGGCGRDHAVGVAEHDEAGHGRHVAEAFALPAVAERHGDEGVEAIIARRGLVRRAGPGGVADDGDPLGVDEAGERGGVSPSAVSSTRSSAAASTSGSVDGVTPCAAVPRRPARERSTWSGAATT
jgi:hypothetical protein